MSAIVFIALFWIAPFFVAYNLGEKKHRRGWLYALLGGWIGVLILACQSEALDPALVKRLASARELELEARLARLEGRAPEWVEEGKPFPAK